MTKAIKKVMIERWKIREGANMIAVREEDIKKLYSSIYDIAAIIRTSPEQVLSWVRSGDLYFGIGTKKDNKILVHKRYLIEFLREQGLLIEKPTYKNIFGSQEVPIII